MNAINTAPVKQEPTKDKHEVNDTCKCSKDCGCCEKKKAANSNGKLKVATALATIVALPASTAFAQTQSTSFWTDPINSPMLPVYMTIGFVAITILLLILVMSYVVRVLNILVNQAEVERAQRLGIPVKKKKSWWQKIWDDLNDAVPVDQEEKVDTGHSYDGIRELDNHLPPWWTGLFYATIIWGFGYLVVYHLTNSLPLSGDEYQAELLRAEESVRQLRASQPAEAIDENTLKYTADAEILARGKTVFASNNCGSCHRNDGGGNNIGPNLTDDYWIHGGSVKSVFVTINAGVVEKGMPAWGKVMSAKDVRDVAFYVMSLKGTNPEGAKGPQGELYQEQPQEPVAADTTQTQALNN